MASSGEVSDLYLALRILITPYRRFPNKIQQSDPFVTGTDKLTVITLSRDNVA